MLDQACHEVLVQGGVNFLGQNWVDPVGPGSDRHATFRDRNLERREEAKNQICLGLGENVSKIAENITQLFDYERGPARAVNITQLFDYERGPARAVKVKRNRAHM